MASKLVGLVVYTPLYWTLIMIDRYIFNVDKGIPNPFLKNYIPRSIPELLDFGATRGRWLFDTVVANCLEKKEGGAGLFRSYIGCKVLGGSEHEPGKSVVRVELTYLESKHGSEMDVQRRPITFNVFVKLSTCRPISCFFKALISAFAEPTVKEVAFNNDVYPFLLSVADDHSPEFGAEFRKHFVVPKNILSVWNRTFDRTMLISECVDMNEYLSNPDWIDLSPDTVELMLHNVAYMHGATLHFHDKTGAVTRYPSKKVEKFITQYFVSEKCGAEWLDAVVHIYIGGQPASVQKIWAQIMKRLKREPTSICHGDYRPGNMLFSRDFSKQIMSDWEANSICPFMWDVTYCMLLGSSTEDRRRDERKHISNYLTKLESIHKKLYYPQLKAEEKILGFPTLDEAMDVYKICLLLVEFFGWALTKFGGVGEKQGNSDKDCQAWSAKVLGGLQDALKDQRELAKILEFEDQEEGHKIILQFIKDLEDKSALAM